MNALWFPGGDEGPDVSRALRALMRANHVLVRAKNERELLDEMCQNIVETAGYKLVWVGYAHDDPDKLIRAVAAAGDTDYLSGIKISWGDNDFGRGPTGVAARTGRVQVLDDTAAPSFFPWRNRARDHGIGSSCALPFKVDNTVGVLSAYDANPGVFKGGALGLLGELTDNLSYGLNRLRDTERLNRNLHATVDALSATVELRDPFTAGHQRRVAKVSEAIGETMGLPQDDIEGIVFAATIHDIGKVGVPIEILTTTAPLTHLQYQLIQTHPRAGHDLLSGVDFPWDVAEIVLQHHERVDGTGYPRGLKRNDILLQARIIAVADVVESMASHRPYRPTRGLAAAIKEISDHADTLYDPAVVEAARVVLDAQRFNFKENPMTDDPPDLGPTLSTKVRM